MNLNGDQILVYKLRNKSYFGLLVIKKSERFIFLVVSTTIKNWKRVVINWRA